MTSVYRLLQTENCNAKVTENFSVHVLKYLPLLYMLCGGDFFFMKFMTAVWKSKNIFYAQNSIVVSGSNGWEYENSMKCDQKRRNFS